MSQGRLSVSYGRAAWQAGRQRDRSKGPAGVDVDVAPLLWPICVFACVCVCFYTEEPWQGQWFSCHSGRHDAIGRGWQVMEVHVRQSGVWARLCVCVCALVQRGTPGYYLPNVTITEPCRSPSPHKRDMLWPYPAHWYLGVITLHWYTGVNGIMYKQLLHTEIKSIYLWYPGVTDCMWPSIATQKASRQCELCDPVFILFTTLVLYDVL